MLDGEQQITLHSFSWIISTNNANCYLFYGNTRYHNLKNIIQSSPQWSMVSDNFSLFRLESIFVEVVPVFRPERGTLNIDISPSLFIDLFPIDTSVTKNFSDVYVRESALRVDPCNNLATNGTFDIPRNYLLNLGSFFPVSSIGSLKGQFSCGGNSPIVSSSGYVCWELYYTLTITVCEDKK